MALRDALSTSTAAGLLAMLVVATGCFTPYRSSRISFESQGDTMSGVLTRPTASAQKAVALLVFVHGDGASVADEYGYNSIVWNRLAEADIASLSWDKKGVGRSQGDWLAQSMDDRAQEVVDALEHIADAYPDAFPTIGLIGFSQAGWVLPKVVQLSSRSDFMIIVSGAINWERQGEYLTRQRMALEGATQLQIDTAVRRQAGLAGQACICRRGARRHRHVRFEPGRYGSHLSPLARRPRLPPRPPRARHARARRGTQ